MTTRVLTTKLYPPPPRPYLVARSRLIERMNAGLQNSRQLLLISATAGFGKTTLASEWITESHLERSTAWISLDEEDNDPSRFLQYLIAALRQINPNLGENILPVLQSHQPAPLTELVAQLINQIAACEQMVLLMLDDYHLITSEAVHQIVQYMIERQPNQMHTVILTREDPPLPLPRMRVRGQVTEIRERDLRFTLPEAHTFLTEAMGLDLSSDDVEKLKERTEGWVAGMQLAALALEDYSDETSRREFIDAFAGSDRFIVDYLVSEVLQRQTGSIRQFLLDTSILERFCSDLCDQVVYGKSSSGNSQLILNELEQGNMFLVPLDNRRQWYRYHHLFGEMLRHSLQRSSPDQVPELHRRASQWLEANGFTPEAVKHALAAGDYEFVGHLLDLHAMRIVFQGQGGLVIGWCKALPEEFLRRSPAICVYFAWALVLTFRNDYLGLVEEKVQLAELSIAYPDQPEFAAVGEGGARVSLQNWVAGQICAIRSQILLGNFNTYVDPQELIALSLQGLELLPESERASRAICKINFAHAQLMQNNIIEAQKAFEEALPFMLEANNYLGGVTCIFYPARLAYYLGQIDRAETLCQQWKGKFSELAGSPETASPTTRGLDTVLSLLLLDRGQFEQAERLLVRTLDVLGWASWMELHGFIILARLRYLRGNYPGVEETLSRMETLGPQHASCAQALRILFSMRTSSEDIQLRTRAEMWAKSYSPNPAAPFALGIGPYHCDVEYFLNLTWAQVQNALGNRNAALLFIEPALAEARSRQLTYRIIELSIAQVMAFNAAGDHVRAFETLRGALDLAEPYAYIRVFDEGPVLDRMLTQAAERNIHPQYVKRLLASFIRTPAQEKTAGIVHPKTTVIQGLVEPLSEREVEVLRLIADGYSNNQIADRLYITQGTVKRHITNLYGKLSVQTRTQAVARGREVGLLA